MSYSLVNKVGSSADGVFSLSGAERGQLQTWLNDEVARIWPELTPAVWFLRDRLEPLAACMHLIGRGEQAMATARAKPGSLVDLGLTESPFWEAVGEHDRRAATEERLQLRPVEWPVPFDDVGWRSAVPALASAFDGRMARLGERVGEAQVSAFAERVRAGLLAEETVPVGPGGVLGTIHVQKWPASIYVDAYTGRQVQVPARWRAQWQGGSPVHHAAQTGERLEGDTADHDLMRGVLAVCAEHDRAVLPGVGTFVRVRTPDRTGTNPRTGEARTIPGRVVIAFYGMEPFTRELSAKAPPPPAPEPAAPDPVEPEPAATTPWWQFW